MNLHDELEGGSLRDLEEALADLAAQNEQLEEDCRDLEAHCRDLERLGYPSPCPVEEVLDEVEHCPVEDSRVEELLRAREKSFQAMAEMQERCSQQQNEMERLLQERTKLQEELSDTKQQLQGLQAQVEREELESQTTGDDSVAESLQGSTSRKLRKKRTGQGFRQARCLEEGVEMPAEPGDPKEVLLRSLLSKAQADSMWYDMIIYLLEKAGEDGLPKPTTEGSVRSQLEFMSYQIHERLLQLGQPEDAGVLESVLKTVGKVTDQAFDSAVLYVDSAVSSPSERSERSPSRASVVEKAESKTSVRERLRLRKQRSRMSVLSLASAE